MKPAGFYNQRIKVYKRVYPDSDHADPDHGVDEGDFEYYQTIWGRVIWERGKVRLQSASMDPTRRGTLYARYHMWLDSDYQFMIDGIMYAQETPPIMERSQNEWQSVIRQVQ